MITITYETAGATGATITNLPNGVTGAWNANVITIQGRPTVTDTYTITLTGGCGYVTAIGKITVNDLPAEPTATTTIVTNCTGTPNGTLTVTSPLGAGYTYSVDGGAFQSEVLFTDLASGNHTLTVKNVSSCTKSTTINIGATPDIPTINITGETTVCKGFTTALTASGAATYNWYKGNTASGEIVCSTAEFTTPPLDVNTTYTVKGTGGNGCTSTQSVTVTVNDKPTISAITQPDNLCAGDALTLTTPTVTNNGSNITSQGWFLNGVAFTSGTVVSYADNGKTLVYKATNNCGETTSNEVTITVNDKPTISAITQPDNLCAGDALTLTTPTVTNNGSNITSQGWFLNGVAFTSGTVVSYADNGKTLVYKATNNCGETTSNEVTITVNDKPTISAITQPDNLCAGDALTLTTPTVTNNGSNITSQGWFLNGVAFTSGTVVSYADNGKTLVYKATNNCGETTSNEVTITVNDKPTISAITQPDNLCAGDALTLTTPTVTNNGSNITSQGWFLNGVAFTSGTVVSYADNGKTLVYKATNNCGETTSNEVTITVNDKPTISAITQPDNLCAGDALTLTTPTVTNNGSNITSQGWFLNGVAFTSGTVVSYADNGKTLVYKATNNCGETTSNEVTITVNDKPTISAITQPDNLCAGDALTLTTPTVTNNGSNITSQGWFLNGVAFTSGTVVSYADNGKTLVYKATNNCGETTSNEVTITVNDKPTISAITQPDNLCAGDALTLTTPTVTNNGSNITSQGWFLNGVAFTSGTVVSYADNGKTLVYKATNNCGETTSNEVTITVNDKPTISAITQPDNLCAGDALTLTTPTVTNNGSNITSQGWFLNGVAFTSGTVVSYADNGKTLVYKATNNCGETTSNEVTITVNDKPTISAITQPDNLCAGDALTLTTPTVTNNGSNITSQGWFLNGVAFTSGTVVSYADNGKTLVYKATNNCGETTSNEVTITVNDKPTISAITQPSQLCAGDALTLTTPTVTNNGSNITSQGWFLNGVAFTSGTVVSYADNGKTLVYKATNNCGETTSNEVTITVNDKPTISAITQPDNLCAGDALTLTTPTVTNNGSNITSQGWFLNGVAFTSGTVVSYADNGKTLVYKATNNCGETTSNEVTITVNDKPTISAITQPDNLCAGDALTLTTPTVTNNGSNITSQGWFLNGVAFTSGTVVSYADNGKTLVYKATNNCGETTSNEVTITVNDKPTISAITQPDNLCAGDALTLTTPTVTNNGSNITSQGWFLNGVAFTSGTVVSYADNGKTLVYKATNNCGETTSNEVTITVNDKPTISAITQPDNLCAGDALTLTTPTVTNNGSNITSQGWFLNGVAFTSGTVVSYADNGKTLVYKATNNCGETTSNEVTITVNDKPTISAITQPDNLCAGDALTLTTPTVTNNGSNITSQGWFLNGVAFTSGTVVSYADNGKTLVYKATNNCGETTSNEVTITVNDKPTISAITQPSQSLCGRRFDINHTNSNQ
ncbi:MAG: beta strand repeat-containing protein [Paludibacteraceae bacterium]